MTGVALLLLAVQASSWAVTPRSPTVGDTVRITRRIPASAGVNATLAPLPPDERMVVLSDPVVAYSEGGVVVQLTVALFETGAIDLSLPDVELLYPDGRVERVAGGSAVVSVASVLPEDEDEPAPRPSLGPLARRTRRPEVPLVVVGVPLLGVLVWGVYRRRARRRPSWSAPLPPVEGPPVDQWMIAGESKAVVTAVSDQLRVAIERAVPDARNQLSTDECLTILESQRPDWPIADLADLLHALDRTRFAPAVPSDVVEMVERTEAMVATLRNAAEESGA